MFSFSQSRSLLWGTSRPLPSAILTHPCGMLTSASQPTTRGGTALDACSGSWPGWFCRWGGTILPGHKWEIMVDLFFYRDPEEAKEEEAAAAPDFAAITDYQATDQWGGDQWTSDVAPPVVCGLNSVFFEV